MKLFIILSLIVPSLTFAGICSGDRSETGNVKIRSYSPKKPGLRQVVILPPTGGENRADRNLAKELCSRGHLVKVVDYPQYVIAPEDFGGHEDATINTLRNLSAFFAEETIPTSIIGASLGGIYASLVFSLAQSEEWKSFRVVDALVTTVAGGSLAEVLTYSTLDHVKKTREGRLAGGDFRTLQDYQNFLDGYIATDLLKLARPGNVLAFTSNSDTVVPTRTQLALAEAHGAKPIRIGRLGHSGTVAYVYYRKIGTIHQFLKQL
ncbi:MAG: hypothetical protein V4598_02250 [Bdellovibrionota bacterium]